ncbi:MAG TPA: DUF3300 domain-containing protein [Candidatus Acidoferrales bacterium]|jgi:hypothetical protein|nr:DUF3300 domain-containing protein [Candidatus Acidoferrales bacterium]
MTPAKYRAPANDAVENRAHLVTRPKFHRDSICTVPFAKLLVLLSLMALFAFRGTAQNAPPPPPPPPAPPAAPEPAPPGPLTEKQLENLVSRIALYPDPLLAQILTACTYGNEIPEAAAWADEHSNLKGEALANAIREDNLQWDPSVLALLPFPSVLDMMAKDPAWIEQLGNAVLVQRGDVMDAVQHLRKQARKYGYLQTNPYCNVVETDGYVEILPVNPAYIYVPYYDPFVVFGPPAPGFFVGGAIRWGPAVIITAGFFPFGWMHPYFLWGAHTIYFDRTPWSRVWVNRGYYVHPYAHPWVWRAGPRVEVHPGPRGR